MAFRMTLLLAVFLRAVWRAYKGRESAADLPLALVPIVAFTLLRTDRLAAREAALIPFQALAALWRVGWPGEGKYMFFSLAGNIFLFMPLGLCLSRREGRVYRYALPLLISLVVEGAQYFSRLGVFELDDLIGNTIGGILGYELGKQLGGQRRGDFTIPGLYLAALGICCLRSMLLA